MCSRCDVVESARVRHGGVLSIGDATGLTVLDERHPDVDGGLHARPVPERFRPVQSWSLGSLDEITVLRLTLLAATAPAGREPTEYLQDVPERMVLVASELATNALTHGAPPTVVTLMSDGAGFLVDVADRDMSSEPRIAGDRPLGAGGFGLVIARRLAQEVGWYVDDASKHVWAAFPKLIATPSQVTR